MKLIFTLTAGRTGTAYLSELLKWNIPQAEVHHEIQTYTGFGKDTPDISQLHAFNNFGNTAEVQAFWRRKYDKIAANSQPVYAETSHLLMKAGLVENITELAREHEVYFVFLKRDAAKIFHSFLGRGDFMSVDNLWMRYLDPGYALNQVHLPPFYSFAQEADNLRIWYLREIEARIMHYRFHYSGLPHVHFHTADVDDLNDRGHIADLFGGLGLPHGEIVIPPKQNISHTVAPLDRKKRAWLESAVEEFGLYRRKAQ